MPTDYPNTSYWCPFCGREFPKGSDLTAIGAHVQAGQAQCNPLAVPLRTPDGFWWECAGCGWSTRALSAAMFHECPRP